MRQLWEMPLGMPLDGGFQGEHLPVPHWFNPAMMVSHLVADGADMCIYQVTIVSGWWFPTFIFHH